MVRVLTVVLPIAILATWGASYIWSCVLVLSAPGRAIEFTYKSTSGGTLRLRGESYAVDWQRGTAFVNELHVFDPADKVVATAAKIDAAGLKLPFDQAIQVRVRDVTGTITRLASGRFDIQDFLPERKGQPSNIPFAVTINRAVVTAIDLSGPSPYRQTAIGQDIEVRGIGDKWLANGAVELPGMGNLRGEVESLPNEGYLARAESGGLQLAPLLAHLRSTPDAKRFTYIGQLHVGSLEAYGPFSIFIPTNKPFEAQSRLKAVVRDFAFQQFRADAGVFNGVISEKGVTGRLNASYGPNRAVFDGSLAWRAGVTFGGQLAVDTPSSALLPAWLRQLIPQDVAFSNSHFAGWLDYERAKGVNLTGRVVGRSATLYGQQISRPDLNLVAGTEQLRLAINSAEWAGTPLKGAVQVGIRSPEIVGALSAGKVDLATVGRRFGIKGLSGKAEVSLLLGGTRTAPRALLQATGDTGYVLAGRRVAAHFQAAGRYAGDRIDIDRFRATSAAGAVRAIGSVYLKGRRLALKVDASNADLAMLRDDLAGSISASGVVLGTIAEPVFRGKAVALGLSYQNQEIPFLSSQITADRQKLRASDLQIVKGTGQARGDLALTWRNLGLQGQLKADNVLLNEYLGDQALGSVTVPKLTLAGTLNRPEVAGTAFGNDLVIGGIRVDRADIVSRLIGTRAQVETFTAKIGQGSVTGSGRYDYSKQAGAFQLEAKDLDISRVTPPGKGAANVQGTLNGNAEATILPPAQWKGRYRGPIIANAKGSLQNVSLNDTEFGNGSWEFAFNGEDVTGNASIGRLDRFLLLENVDYDTANETIAAQVSVLNGALQDLYTSIKPFFPNLPFDVREKLDAASGDINATVAFAGRIADPDIDVKVLDVYNLAVGDNQLGTLKANLTKAATTWTVDTFDWSGPQGTLVLAPGSSVDTAGSMRVDGEISNFDLKYVGVFNPDWAQLQGSATASFLVTGAAAAPNVRASIETAKGSAITFAGSQESFKLNLDTVIVSPTEYLGDGRYTGGITAQGKFFYRGLTGDIAARLPFDYPFSVPNGPQITASLTFPDVDIHDLAEYASALDVERSSGHLTGSISISGPRENLALSGALSGQADTIAFIVRSGEKGTPTPLQTTLKAAIVDVKLENHTIGLTLSAMGSEGGDFSAKLSADLPNLKDAFEDMLRGDTESFSRIPLSGALTATDFSIRQDSQNKDFGTYHAKVNSTLTVSGPAMEPTIAGRVGVTQTNILLPSIFEGAGPGAEMLFNPHFEIPIQLDEVARFRTSTADVSLLGGGTLAGSLAEPNFTGTLTVASGRINLPTARVTLEEGGTLRPSYQVGPEGEASARVDVNMEGRTAVTAIRYGDVVQRYDIRLFITGDLLTEGGLTLNATSDPPDLSKDEILGLLGQTDVLKSIGSGTGVSQSEAEARIRNALISIAVPQLTQGFTSQIASNLGLEYLNLEYNPIEGASIAFAKVLGKGLVLQGRRQVSPPIGNRKVDYELKLNYRLPTRNAALSRVVFSAGLDQDRPWKLGVEYGFRF